MNSKTQGGWQAQIEINMRWVYCPRHSIYKALSVFFAVLMTLTISDYFSSTQTLDF